MRKIQVPIFICLFIAAVSMIVFTKSRNISQEGSASVLVKNQDKDASTLKVLQDSRIVAYGQWNVSETESASDSLWYIVRAFDQDPNYQGPGVKFSILTTSGESLYEDYFSEVSRVYSVSALRNEDRQLETSPQLVMEVDYGGSSNFLLMLHYKKGKVISLTDTMKLSGDFDVAAEVRPQFRSGTQPAMEPFQILLTHGGLASPREKIKQVFRCSDGGFRPVGSFSQRKVDDFIDMLMNNSKTVSKAKP